MSDQKIGDENYLTNVEYLRQTADCVPYAKFVKELRDHAGRLREIATRLEHVEADYWDLISQVQNVRPDKTRHQAARDIIHDSEARIFGPVLKELNDDKEMFVDIENEKGTD